MNKTTKLLAVFLTAGLLLAGCGQKRVRNLLVHRPLKRRVKQQANHPLKKKTKESSTDESKKEDALAGAQKNRSRNE